MRDPKLQDVQTLEAALALVAALGKVKFLSKAVTKELTQLLTTWSTDGRWGLIRQVARYLRQGATVLAVLPARNKKGVRKAVKKVDHHLSSEAFLEFQFGEATKTEKKPLLRPVATPVEETP